MALNDREKVIAGVVGGVLGVVALGYLLQLAYLGPRQSIVNEITKAQEQNQKEDGMLAAGNKAKKAYAASGILMDSAKLTDEVQSAVSSIAQSSGFAFSSWHSSLPRTVQNKPEFDEVSYTASGDLTTTRLAVFLKTFEEQNLPARIKEMTVTARTPGKDDLRVDMTIVAYLYHPLKDKKALTLSLGAAAPGYKPAAIASGTGTTDLGTGYTRGTGGYTATYGYGTNSILNAPPGSLDPGLPPGSSMEGRLALRREMQLSDKPLPPPRAKLDDAAAATPAAVSTAATSTAPAMTDEELMKRRQQEELSVATAPATAPAAK